MTGEPGPDLPKTIPEGARVYLRPLGLVGGAVARALVSGGGAAWLAGGPLAFRSCELAIRPGSIAERHRASLAGLEAWAGALPAGPRQVLLDRLEALQAPRGGGAERPSIMGVVNATPDSFSDGGRYLDAAAAIAHGTSLAEAGADIIDIGGESTRPGAEPVDPAVERERVVPVVEALAAAGVATISIDTRRASVMAAALDAGATMINDVTALAGDPESLAAAAGSEARIALMHMQGEPRTMNESPVYDDVLLDVFDFLEKRVEACMAAGITRERLLVDPGLGFGKKGAQNRALLRDIAIFHGLGCPVLLGASRKGVTGGLERAVPPGDRLPGSLAAALWARSQGVQVLRVHDVAETRQALAVWDAIAAR